MVRALVTAYGRFADEVAVPRQIRIGLAASFLRKILRLGFVTPVSSLVRDCTLLVFMFISGCRESTAAAVRPSDMAISELDIAASTIARGVAGETHTS
jgi:hypothetical protein